MKSRSLRPLFYAPVLLCVAVSIEAAEDVPPSALALADALQVVETTRLTMEARIKAGIETGRNSEQELGCWKATDFTPVRSVFAEALARLLTSAEMDEARTFLAKPLGRKVMQFMNAESAKARGWQWPSAAPLTEEEAVEALEFLSTSAGKKIYSDELQSPEMQKRMVDRMLPMFQKCMEPKSTAQRFENLEASMTPEERERAAASAADKTRPSQSDAIKLVRAMREDELFVALLHQRTKRDTRPMPKARRDCIESLRPTDVTSALVPAVQEHLSASEVKDAIGFYESEVGRKYTNLIFDNLERPTELADFMKVISIDETRSLRKFFVTSASRKLMEDKVTQEPASMNRIGLRLQEFMDSCLSKSGTGR